MTAPLQQPADQPVPPAQPFQPRPPARRDRGMQLLFLVAGLVAVSGIAFAVGRLTAPPAAAAAANGRGFGNGFGGFGNGANASFAPGGGRGLLGGGAGATVRGTVVSVNGSSLTLKLADGATATIQLSGTTTYHRQAAASSSDIAPGGQVEVQVQFQPRTPGSTPAPSGATRTITAAEVTLVGQ